MILDEAHHKSPVRAGHVTDALPYSLGETVFVTVHADHLAPPILAQIDVILAVGPSPDQTLRTFSKASGHVLTWPEELSYTGEQLSLGSLARADVRSLRVSFMLVVSAFATAANMQRVICAIEASIFAGRVAATT